MNGQKLLLVLVFALLDCNTAGSLASRLAGCLAFAAAAVLNAFLHISCLDSNNSFHGEKSPYKILFSLLYRIFPLLSRGGEGA